MPTTTRWHATASKGWRMLDNELNARLVKAFQVLRQEAYRETENGDVADGRLRGCLETHGGLPVVSNALWKKRGVKDVPATYTEARDKVAAGVFTFSTDFETPFIVDKPNGKQAWPDCLVVYRHTGLPVEFKLQRRPTENQRNLYLQRLRQ